MQPPAGEGLPPKNEGTDGWDQKEKCFARRPTCTIEEALATQMNALRTSLAALSNVGPLEEYASRERSWRWLVARRLRVCFVVIQIRPPEQRCLVLLEVDR